MKKPWCAETASKSYIDTVKSIQPIGHPSNVAELLSAMAGGSKSLLIVEAWSPGADGVATSVGLTIASRHTGGRHVCVVPDEESRLEYLEATEEAAGEAPEVLIGDAEKAMASLAGVDFLVVDCRRKDFGKFLRLARVAPKGAVFAAKNAGPRGLRWRAVIGSDARVVRSAFLPVGKGVEIAQVVLGGGSGGSASGNLSRWIKHVDRCTGEEHVFRR